MSRAILLKMPALRVHLQAGRPRSLMTCSSNTNLSLPTPTLNVHTHSVNFALPCCTPSWAASLGPCWPAVTCAPVSLRQWEAPKGIDSLLPSLLLHKGPGTPRPTPLSAPCRDCVNTLYFSSFPPGRHVECEQAVCKMVVGSAGGMWVSPWDAHPGPQAL